MNKCNRKFLDKKKINILILIIMYVFIFRSIYDNKNNIVNQKWFNDYQKDSEDLVIGRLIRGQENLFFDKMFLSRITEKNSKEKFIAHKKYLENNKNIKISSIYYQQVGLNGTLYSIGDKILKNVTPKLKLNIFYGINSAALSILLIILIYWFYKEFSIVSSIGVFLAIYFNNWVIVMGRNLYWNLYLYFLPFISILFILYLNSQKKLNENKILKYLFGTSYLTILFKSLNGYEFISAVLISLTLPIFYYSLKNSEYKIGAKNFLSCSIGGILGFFTAILIHLFQLKLFFGSFKKGIEMLIYTIAKRTGAFNVEMSSQLKSTLNVKVEEVIKLYLDKGMPLILSYKMNQVLLIFFVFILISLIDRKYLISLYKNRKKILSLLTMTLISILAPLSWFVLSKGHSVVHQHINYILWSLPTLLLIVGFIFEILNCILLDTEKIIMRYINSYSRKKILLLLGLFLIIISLLKEYKKYNFFKSIFKYENNLVKNDKVEIFIYNNSLYYFIKNYQDNRFFLHIIPNDLKDLKPKKNGEKFNNLDFDGSENIIENIFIYKKVIIKKELPPYLISYLSTGQFNKNEREWQELNLEINTLIKSSLSDSNWDNGIFKNKKIILLEDLNIDINKFKEFKTIKFINGSGKKYEILSVEEKGKYIHISLKKEVNEKDFEAKEIKLGR